MNTTVLEAGVLGQEKTQGKNSLTGRKMKKPKNAPHFEGTKNFKWPLTSEKAFVTLVEVLLSHKIREWQLKLIGMNDSRELG